MRFDALQEGRPYLGDVRGLGLMLGIECVSDAATLAHAPKLAAWIRVRHAAKFHDSAICAMHDRHQSVRHHE